MPPQPDLTVADAAAWRAWLDLHESDSDGVWLTLAKKGVTEPTSLRYAEALDEALCSGWIDGQVRAGGVDTYAQRFTPRRARSMWSARNVGYIARLEAEGRMRPRGREEVAKAQSDGRWDRAYSGPKDVVVPEDLVAALTAVPGARERFDALSKSARYQHLHPIITAVRPETRARRIAKTVEALREG